DPGINVLNTRVQAPAGALTTLAEIATDKADNYLGASREPQGIAVAAEWTTAKGTFKNEWLVWVTSPEKSKATVWLHASCAESVAAELFPSAKRLTGPPP